MVLKSSCLAVLSAANSDATLPLPSLVRMIFVVKSSG